MKSPLPLDAAFAGAPWCEALSNPERDWRTALEEAAAAILSLTVGQWQTVELRLGEVVVGAGQWPNSTPSTHKGTLPREGPERLLLLGWGQALSPSLGAMLEANLTLALSLRHERAKRTLAELVAEQSAGLLRALRRLQRAVLGAESAIVCLRGAVAALQRETPFAHAWAVLVDDTGQPIPDGYTYAASEDDSPQLRDYLCDTLRSGGLPPCLRAAVDAVGVVRHAGQAEACGTCPMLRIDQSRHVLACAMRYGGRTFGYLAVSLPVALAQLAESAELVKEIGATLAEHLLHLEQRRVLNERSVLLETLLNTIPAPVFYKNAAGRYLGFNQAFTDALGAQRGQTVHDLVPAPIAETIEATDLRLLRGEWPRSVDAVRVQFRDGLWHDLSVVRAAYRNEAGEIAGIIGVLHDVSDLRQSQSDLELARRALDASQNGVLIARADANYSIIYANKSFYQLTGYSPLEVLGRNCRFLHGREEKQPGLEVIRDGLRQRQACRATIRNFRRDGTPFWNRLTIFPMADERGEVTHFVGVQEDVTEAVQQQEELARAKEVAEKASQTKGEFLAVVSHEMRSPLNPILGFADLLLQDCETEPERTYLQTIQQAAERQLSLVNNILQFSRLDRATFQPKWSEFELVAVFEQARLSAQQQATHLNLQLRNGFGGWLAIDRTLRVRSEQAMLQRLLDNLLGNAVKYTRQGWVELAFGLERHEGRRAILHVAVSDSGIGISDEAQLRLFQPFSQVDSSYTREFEGAGLGLAICRKLVDFLGGKIGVESTVGQGSTFWFHYEVELVFRPDLTPKAPRGRPLQALERPLHILVVDDRPDNVAYACALIERMGGTTATVAHGGLAISRCETEKFDVILMDLAMPMMDGLEATQLLRQNPGLNQHTPVIAVTADVTSGVEPKCRMAGMQGYVAKPIDSERLFRLLEHYAQVSTQGESA